MRGKRRAEPNEVDFFEPLPGGCWGQFSVLVMILVLPVMFFVSLPEAFDSGAPMMDAPRCSSDDLLRVDCLEFAPAHAVEPESCRKGCFDEPWFFELQAPRPDVGGRNLQSTTDVKLPFPEFGTHLARGEPGDVVFWNGDAVAFRHADGSLEESLDWGYGYVVTPRIFVALPFLLVLFFVGRWWLMRWRHNVFDSPEAVLYLAVLASCFFGWLCWLLFGTTGLVSGLVVPLLLALVWVFPALRRRSQGRHEKQT